MLMGVLLCAATTQGYAQASALPSAGAAPVTDVAAQGHVLLQAMVKALGGPAWLGRTTARIEGKGATFYKGLPNPYETQYEEYLRFQPFGERIVIVSKQGVFIPTTKRDVVEIWTPENGYEVSYHGRKELPKVDVEDFERRRRHSIDTVVGEWLKRPDTLVTYEGTEMEERRLVDRVSVLTAENDAVTLSLDHETHLPRSRSFQWRNPQYKDFDTDVERYDNWQDEGGILTALTITGYHNGDMTRQRFLAKVQYGLPIAPEALDPDATLPKK